MPFESVVLGSDHPSSCCTIMTRDISLLSTYLVILIPCIDCLVMNERMNLAHLILFRGPRNQFPIRAFKRRVVWHSRDSEMMEEFFRLKVKINIRTSASEFDVEYRVVPCLKHDRRKFGVLDFGKAFGIFDLW